MRLLYCTSWNKATRYCCLLALVILAACRGERSNQQAVEGTGEAARTIQASEVVGTYTYYDGNEPTRIVVCSTGIVLNLSLCSCGFVRGKWTFRDGQLELNWGQKCHLHATGPQMATGAECICFDSVGFDGCVDAPETTYLTKERILNAFDGKRGLTGPSSFVRFTGSEPRHCAPDFEPKTANDSCVDGLQKGVSTCIACGLRSQSGRWRRVQAVAGLPVRDAPSVSGAIVGTVPHLEFVEVTATICAYESVLNFDDEWVKIRYRDTAGFALNPYLLRLNYHLTDSAPPALEGRTYSLGRGCTGETNTEIETNLRFLDGNRFESTSQWAGTVCDNGSWERGDVGFAQYEGVTTLVRSGRYEREGNGIRLYFEREDESFSLTEGFSCPGLADSSRPAESELFLRSQTCHSNGSEIHALVPPQESWAVSDLEAYVAH